jgi:Fe-S-cluster containining protein
MDAYQQLDAIYADLPTIDCQGFCHTSCGPIDMSRHERTRIRTATGISIDARSAIRDGWADCPALTQFGRCSVYDLRPIICRLYGLTRQLPCGYGCRPERWLTDKQAMEYLARVAEISGEAAFATAVRSVAADPAMRALLHTVVADLNKQTKGMRR